MANANPPIAQLARVDINSIQGKKFLIDLLNQLWLRTGGPVDTVSDTDSNASTVSSRLVSRINDVVYEVEQLRAELNSVRSLLRSSVSDNEQNIDDLLAKCNRTQASMVELIEKIEDLEALV